MRLYKTIVHTGLLAAVIVVIAGSAKAQGTSGMGFEYSLLVRDSVGKVKPLAPVTLNIYLLPTQNSLTTDATWAETQAITTDNYGFGNLVIGTGIRTGGSVSTFAGIDFSLYNYWVLIQANIQGSLQTFIKEPLMAVPYAKTAGTVAGSLGMPAGIVTPFAGDTSQIPAGWVLCNGAELDNTNPLYTALYNAIGFTWGTSDHIHKFNLPNMQGMFLRGAFPNAALNAGASQQDQFYVHSHGFMKIGIVTNKLIDNTHQNTFNYITQLSTELATTDNTTSGEFTKIVTKYGLPKYSAYETRPVNVAVNYIIKL